MIQAFLKIGSRPAWIAPLAILIAVFVPSVYAQPPSEASRVHFLLAIDTVDRSSKALGLDLDRDHVKKVIHDSMKALGYPEGPQGRYTDRTLEGNEMTQKMELDHNRRLIVGENVTLVFYYTGHGGFYPEKGHLLAMRNYYNIDGKQWTKYATVDRKELLAAMSRHNPRAIIVLTDCCASTDVPVYSGVRLKAPNPAFKTNLKGQGKGEVFRDLFFRSQGVVNITAAMTGTPARGDRKKGGSHFTVALTNLLRESPQLFDDNGDKLVEWREFFPRLTTLTQIESDLRTGRPQDFHTPEAFLLAEPIQKAKGTIPTGGKKPILEKEESLTRTDPTYQKGKQTFFIKSYPVKMQKDRAYLVSLHSSQFDTFLFVKNAAGKTLAFNDDYGNTTTRSRVLFFPPADDTYQVGVSSYGAGETGDFSLTIQESLFNDALTPQDRKDRYCLGSFAKKHAVHLKALRNYTVQLESEDTDKFDPFLRIVDEFGDTVALNDDEDEAQGRLNSLVTFRTVSSGTYYVVATSFAPGQTGRYGVFVQD